MQTWDFKQTRAFLRATAEHKFAALFLVALSVGLRRGELLALRWIDVDLKAGRLYVQNTLSGDGTIAETKTAGFRRTIELPASTVAALTEQRTRVGVGAKFVFPGEDDRESYLPRKVNHEFNRAVADAGLPVIRFYDMRHTCASLRLAAGDHPKVVSEILGHGSVAITLSTCSHVLGGLQRAAADRFDSLLEGR